MSRRAKVSTLYQTLSDDGLFVLRAMPTLPRAADSRTMTPDDAPSSVTGRIWTADATACNLVLPPLFLYGEAQFFQNFLRVGTGVYISLSSGNAQKFAPIHEMKPSR